MNHTIEKTEQPKKNYFLKKIRYISSIILAFFLFVLALSFDAWEKVSEIVKKYENIEIDEVILVLAILAIVSLIFYKRKNRELKHEIAERDKMGKDLKDTTEQLKAFNEANKKLTSMISNEELLPWIAEQAAKLLNVDACNYRIREGNYLVRGGGTREAFAILPKERIKIGESLSGWIAKENKPIIITDGLSDDPRLFPEHRKKAVEYGYRSALGVPMCIDEENVGVLIVLSTQPREFTEADRELLFAFANQAAIAIKNAKLFKDLKKAKDELEMSNKNLEKRVTEKSKELKEMQAHLIYSERLTASGRLASGMAREISNPLQAIDCFISSVMKNLDKKSQDREYLGLAKEGIHRIETIVRKLLEFHRPEAIKKRLEDINSIIKNTLSLTRNQLLQKNIVVVEDFSANLPEVNVSPQQFHQVLLNLITNAEDAMPDGGELRIRTRNGKRAVYIDISDTGAGMPEELLGRIFDPFFTINKDKGIGLGLSISYGIIKTHDGEILVKSKEKEGSTFTIKLPVEK